jgi:hypothetical protein
VNLVTDVANPGDTGQVNAVMDRESRGPERTAAARLLAKVLCPSATENFLTGELRVQLAVVKPRLLYPCLVLLNQQVGLEPTKLDLVQQRGGHGRSWRAQARDLRLIGERQ